MARVREAIRSRDGHLKFPPRTGNQWPDSRASPRLYSVQTAKSSPRCLISGDSATMNPLALEQTLRHVCSSASLAAGAPQTRSRIAWHDSVATRVATESTGRRRLCARHQVEGNVGDHVFLTADQLAGADFDENLSSIEPVQDCCAFGVSKETRIRTGEAH